MALADLCALARHKTIPFAPGYPANVLTFYSAVLIADLLGFNV